MKVENLISICFTEKEVKESLLMLLEYSLNDLVPTTPEYNRLEKIIDHVRDNSCAMEWLNGVMMLSMDGIVKSETWEI